MVLMCALITAQRGLWDRVQRTQSSPRTSIVFFVLRHMFSSSLLLGCWLLPAAEGELVPRALYFYYSYYTTSYNILLLLQPLYYATSRTRRVQVWWCCIKGSFAAGERKQRERFRQLLSPCPGRVSHTYTHMSYYDNPHVSRPLSLSRLSNLFHLRVKHRLQLRSS